VPSCPDQNEQQETGSHDAEQSYVPDKAVVQNQNQSETGQSDGEDTDLNPALKPAALPQRQVFDGNSGDSIRSDDKSFRKLVVQCIGNIDSVAAVGPCAFDNEVSTWLVVCR
tara:strand:+ start:125 stop:460 length:336 start_codon:yes stop_codon:yes gene_type:complete